MGSVSRHHEIMSKYDSLADALAILILKPGKEAA